MSRRPGFLSTIRRDESGIALPAVIILSVILMTLVAASTGFALSSLNTSRHDQDWNGALAAAEAGIDDYLYRLNRDSEYWQYDDATPPPDGNQAFAAWVDVPGSGDAEFRYFVDDAELPTQGIIKVVSSGRVRGAVRTVEALLRRRSFLDYLYFTEYETKDPAAYEVGDAFTPAQAEANCAKHYYDNPGRHENCTEINFFSGDIIKGPLHTNDAMLISGSPTFQGETTTSWDGTCPGGTDCTASATRYRVGTGTVSPNFANPGEPSYAATLTMPPSNSSIKEKADASLGGVGCLYTGPTSIILNSNGTMSVTSPLTKSSNPNCVGTNKPLPANGVIFVQAVPTSPSNPNYSASCPVSSGNPLGYPISQDFNTSQYGCFDGDAFVRGTLDGALTIASQDSIIITGDTTYAGGLGGNDILGLVADNYVEIYHPVKCNSWYGGLCVNSDNLTGSVSNVDVHAAILTVKHSFRVQAYRYGEFLQDLTVYGSIGQQYRGIVGTFSGGNGVTGYEKDYTYDQKLRYTSPPHFLDPVASAWGVNTWAECEPMPVPGSC
jgi:hypothetical protein